MRRQPMQVRENYQQHLEDACSFYYHTDEEKDAPYWDESAAYEFSAEEIDRIEAAANVVYELAVETVDELIRTDRLDKLYIPKKYHPFIAKSWENDVQSMIGRFDMTLDRFGGPKVLEFNADTPFSLNEAAIVQAEWLETNGQTPKDAQQYNLIHEYMVEGFKWLKTNTFKSDHVHFTAMAGFEDMSNLAYAAACAEEAGLTTTLIDCEDIGVQGEVLSKEKFLVDTDDRDIQVLYKLYPWEMILDGKNEELAKAVLNNKTTQFIEPLWKMAMSNKALLGVMYEMHGATCPYLLPAYNDNCGLSEQEIARKLDHSYAKKPILSREGANVTLVENGRTICESAGEYGGQGYVYQKLAKLQEFEHIGADATTEKRYPVLGVWMIGGEARGMGIRESGDLITGNMSCFIPHYFTPTENKHG